MKMELTNEFRDSPPHWAARIRQAQVFGKASFYIDPFILLRGEKSQQLPLHLIGGKKVRCYVTSTHHAETALFPYVSSAFIFAFLCALFCENQVMLGTLLSLTH